MLPNEFDALAVSWGWPKYRARQLRDWVYNKTVSTVEEMTNLSRADRQKLSENVAFSSAAIATRQNSSDGTQKLFLSWLDSSNAETVMIPDGDRRTACVSSQVGCPV